LVSEQKTDSEPRYRKAVEMASQSEDEELRKSLELQASSHLAALQFAVASITPEFPSRNRLTSAPQSRREFSDFGRTERRFKTTIHRLHRFLNRFPT